MFLFCFPWMLVYPANSQLSFDDIDQTMLFRAPADPGMFDALSNVVDPSTFLVEHDTLATQLSGNVDVAVYDFPAPTIDFHPPLSLDNLFPLVSTDINDFST